jgi:LEA14-like dessication related protein
MMMKNWHNIFKTAVILVLTVTGVSACSVLQQAIEKPKVHVESVAFHPVSLKEGRLDSRMQIHNPNSFSLPLRKLAYQLKLNGREFVNSTLSFDKDIPAKGTIALQVPIHFHYGELLHGLSSIFERHDIQFQLSGKMDFGVVTIPFSKTGEFALRR